MDGKTYLFPSIMGLPLELRIKIWRHVMKTSSVTLRYHNRYTVPKRSRRAGTETDYSSMMEEVWNIETGLFLASTCRQIYHDVAPVYYGDTIFRVYTPKVLSSFIKHVRPQCVRQISHIECYGDIGNDNHMISLLELFTALKTFKMIAVGGERGFIERIHVELAKLRTALPLLRITHVGNDGPCPMC